MPRRQAASSLLSCFTFAFSPHLKHFLSQIEICSLFEGSASVLLLVSFSIFLYIFVCLCFHLFIQQSNNILIALMR